MNLVNTISNRFMGSLETSKLAKTVIIGAPMDFTCSFKPGSRFGPQKIREISYGIEEFSFLSEKDLNDSKYYDAGDIDLPFGNPDKSIDMIFQVANEIISNSKFPIFIGGEHLISFPVVKAVYKKFGDDLIIIHLDAHADLRDDYMGESNSHASVMKRISEFISPDKIFQLGIRSGTKEELEFAKKNTNIYLFSSFINSLESIIDDIKDKPVYITLDIDVVDPAFANGTGTPEPGGITSLQIIDTVLKLMKLNVVGFDLVEVAPIYDSSDRTSLLAAKIIREVILNI